MDTSTQTRNVAQALARAPVAAAALIRAVQDLRIAAAGLDVGRPARLGESRGFEPQLRLESKVHIPTTNKRAGLTLRLNRPSCSCDV